MLSAADFVSFGTMVAHAVRDVAASLYQNDPYHVGVELALAVWVLYLMFKRSYSPKGLPEQLTQKEISELIEEWTPAPLCPALSEREVAARAGPVLDGIEPGGALVRVADRTVVNMAALNFAGLMANTAACETTIAVMGKYGVGSCGPRGFYGTIDKHVELEVALANFLGVDEAILYSYGFATIASAIPAFAKKSDVVVADKSVSFAVLTGLNLSRAHVLWYEHNDMDDLERVLAGYVERSAARGERLNRRFIVTEGLFVNTGTICALPQIVALKNKYKFRLMLEESCSFGVLGATGRGVTEHFGVPMSEVLFVTASTANALGCEGGFCAGPRAVVDHQRLSGLGYCYSASAPPMLSAGTRRALEVLDAEPERPATARRNAAAMRKRLAACALLALSGDDESPVIHVRLAEGHSGQPAVAERFWDAVVAAALDDGLLLVRARYNSSEEKFEQAPSLRVAVSAAHTARQIDAAAATIIRLVSETAPAGPVSTPGAGPSSKKAAAAAAAPAAAPAATASKRRK